jgi:putative glycosyltransferase (TIGR04372 family)
VTRDLWRSCRRRLNKAIVICHIPLILLVRLLRPIIHIRFGWLQTHKIGHLPLEAEHYFCEKQAGLQPSRSIDLFFDRRRGDGEVCNETALAMTFRRLTVLPWIRYLFEANRLVPGSRRHEVLIKAREEYNCRDRDGLFSRFPTQITFTEEEQQRGVKCLADMGIPADGKIVCFHVRDAAYWRGRMAKIGNDSDYRNCDIDDFVPAMKALLERGFYVVRIGFPVGSRLNLDHPRFVDYSYDHRSPFMDMFLPAHCHLMVSTGSGVDSISYMFRRPILMCNLAPCGYFYSDSPRITNMLKLHRRQGSADFMTYAEVHAAGADQFTVTNQYLEAGIEYLDAFPEVIQKGVLEAIARIDGSWIDTAEDRELEARFLSLYRDDPFHGAIRGHISTEFLRAYRHLV